VSLNQPTPARLTALATSRLSTLVLVGIVLLYALLGLFARDPWKTADVVGLATMVTAVQEGGWSWLFPHIGQSALPEGGPLMVWVGGAFVLVLGSVFNDIVGARLATLVWLIGSLVALWYACYFAGRRPEAQPLALPFGGEPKEIQYGRLLADMGVLFLIATVGIILRTHETSEAPILLAWQAIALLGAIRLSERTGQGVVLLSLAVAGGFFTGGSMSGLPLLMGSLLVLAMPSANGQKRLATLLGLTLAILSVLVWFYIVQQVNAAWATDWWYWNRPQWGWGYLETHLKVLRDLPWFVWPTWPLAFLAIWNWRKHLTAPHIWVPTAFLVSQLINIGFTPNPSEMEYMALTVPCAMLAAFSVPTLRRAVVNAVDWFALMCFSVTVVCVWLGWIAQQTGLPTGIANNIARQTVGYESQISWGAVAMGLVITLTWVGFVVWRLRLHPKMAWRGALLCAGGLTSTWILLVLLWLPTVDYVRSYRPMSADIQAVLEEQKRTTGRTPCLQSIQLSLGAQASLYVFDGIKVTRNADCSLILQQTTAERLRLRQAGFDTNARTLWTGSRGADRFDRYRILEIVPAP